MPISLDPTLGPVAQGGPADCGATPQEASGIS
jgi:hypothetical protein